MENKAMAAQAAEALPVGMICCRMDEDLTFLWGNSRFFSLTGYTREEFCRRFPSLRRYCAAESAAFRTLLQAAESAAAGGVEAVVSLPMKSGGSFHARLSGTAAEDGGPVFQAVLTGAAAPPARQEEPDRRQGQALDYFHFMLDEYIGNIYICDMETYELLYLNQSSCDTLGGRAADLVGRKCYEVIQGRTSPCPFCTNGKLTEDAFYEWEFYNPTLERTFMIKNRIIRWKGRRARLELSHDMFSTEYKLAKKNQERDALLRSVPGGFARLDARDFSTVLWYGADFLHIIGYTAEQFETELHSRSSYIHPDDMGRIVPLMQELAVSGGSAVTEAKIVTRGGESRILTLTLAYASGADSWDGIPSFYTVGIDVTAERMEQAKQRTALEEAYEVARVANDAKTNFLSSMSHDIRTPMNAIMGMAVIAQANLNAPEKVRECLNKINTSSRHLLSLINEVLDMSKIESGKIDLVSETVSLPELLQNVMDMCRPLALEKSQELRISADHVRHETVVTDGGRLQQVLMNLVSNGVKYTPDGGAVSLRVRELPSPAGLTGQYEFVVSDNGIGMSEEFIPHIFEPFSRAEDSRISKIQGTGLGMAITDNIIRMMNGTIQVRSKLGAGSRFIVTVPLTVEAEEASPDAELTGRPVLVVDDDQAVCESAAALLDELGMRGFWVLSGEEAVRRVAEAHTARQDFFAVILDWKMPGMDGLETLRAIRARLGDKVPIIIISAYDYSDIEEEFRQAGADAFITKPLFKSKLLHVMQLFSRLPPQESPGAETAGGGLAGKRILLAEDNELNREIAVELLEMNRLSVTAVEDGEKAVEAFRAAAPGTYDCILMDIQMPVMDGYAASAAIRELERPDGRTIPIIALTANVFSTDLGKARSVGMNDHVPKPIEIGHLLEVLQRWL